MAFLYLLVFIPTSLVLKFMLSASPVLVSCSFEKPMDLVFGNPIELIAIVGVAFAVNALSPDGDVTWFEGALLLGVNLLMSIAFFGVTPT